MFSLRTWRKKSSQKGAIIVLTALMLPVVLGFAGMAVDVGNILYHRAQLQNAADASAAAGAQQYAAALSNSKSNAKSLADTEAKLYINGNGVTGLADSNISLTVHSSKTSNTTQYYVVNLTESVDTYFMKLFVSDPITISGQAYGKVWAASASAPLFNNLITFQNNLNLVNDGKKTWDGKIVHTSSNATVSTSGMGGTGTLYASDGTSFNPSDSQYYDKSLAIGLDKPAADGSYPNAALQTYVTTLTKTTTPVKPDNGQSISSSYLAALSTSTITYVNDIVSSIYVTTIQKNTTQVLVLTSGTINIHIQNSLTDSNHDSTGQLVIIDLSGGGLNIEGQGVLRATVYAPNTGSLLMNPNGMYFYGSIVAPNVDIQAASKLFSQESPNIAGLTTTTYKSSLAPSDDVAM